MILWTIIIKLGICIKLKENYRKYIWEIVKPVLGDSSDSIVSLFSDPQIWQV